MNQTELRRVGKGLLRRLSDSGLSINAAAVAYNGFLALVPLAFAVLGVAAVIGQSAAAVERIDSTLEPIAPEAVRAFITDLMVDAGDRVGGGSVLLIIGSVVVAVVFGSRAVVALQKALAAVENRTEQRPALQMRLVAVALTIAGGGALVVSSLLLVSGERVVEFFAELVGNDILIVLWRWLRVPVAAAGLYAFVIVFYRYGPPEPLPQGWLAALVATAGVVLGSLGFGWYLSASPELGATIGALGAVAVALIWMYVGATAILFGAVVVAYLSRNADMAGKWPGSSVVPEDG